MTTDSQNLYIMSRINYTTDSNEFANSMFSVTSTIDFYELNSRS